MNRTTRVRLILELVSLFGGFKQKSKETPSFSGSPQKKDAPNKPKTPNTWPPVRCLAKCRAVTIQCLRTACQNTGLLQRARAVRDFPFTGVWFFALFHQNPPPPTKKKEATRVGFTLTPQNKQGEPPKVGTILSETQANACLPTIVRTGLNLSDSTSAFAHPKMICLVVHI